MYVKKGFASGKTFFLWYLIISRNKQLVYLLGCGIYLLG